MIEVLAIGSSVHYPDRPEDDIYMNTSGFGHWVFMHFTTPFRVRTPLGSMEREAGDFLINTPDYPQWHQGRGVCFKNDWFHFDGTGIGKRLENYDIPLNIPFTCFQESRILNILHEIQREHILKDQYQKEKQDLLVGSLFLETARGLKYLRESTLSEREKELLPLFQELRVLLHHYPEKVWTVPEMAGELSLSTNRFAVLYKRFFSISPLQDQMEVRLGKASSLLLNETAKIENISRECGFSSVQYFWRMFKSRYHMSPSEFRRSRRVPL